MKIILLAAGRSKRLKPIEDKNFISMFGQPMIAHQLRALLRFSKDVLIVGGAHNLDKLKEVGRALQDDVKGSKVDVIGQVNLDLGMCGALQSASKKIKSGDVLIVSGNDVVTDDAFEIVLKQAKKTGIDGVMLAKKVTSYFPGGYLKIDKNGLIKGIVEKPGAGKEPSDLVNIVVHYHKDFAKLLAELKKVKSEKDDKYEVALDNLIKKGDKYVAAEFKNFWQAIKYPWHVLVLMNVMIGNIDFMIKYYLKRKSGIHKSAQIAKSAKLNGKNIMIEEGVKIMDNAVIVGPAYIGKNSVVATNALVRDSHIGENCVIGFGTEIARSHLGNNVWTHTNYIGDSVIGNNVSFGAGTVTGNLRLDEGNIQVNISGEKIDSGMNKFGLVTGDNVRVGINTSFMPGVKIGKNCMIGGGIIVANDVEDNKFVYGKMELVVKDNKIDVGKINRDKTLGNLKK